MIKAAACSRAYAIQCPAFLTAVGLSPGIAIDHIPVFAPHLLFVDTLLGVCLTSKSCIALHMCVLARPFGFGHTLSLGGISPLCLRTGTGDTHHAALGHAAPDVARPGEIGLTVQLFNFSFIVAALFFAALGPARWAAPVLAAGAGLIIAGDMALQPNILMSLGPPQIRKDIVSLAALALIPFTLIIPPLSGLLIEVVGHRPVFALGGLVGMRGLMLLYGLSGNALRSAQEGK